ncbi:MAG: 2Fe-2S iron-sulfur cluster-binding protein [Streptosporangiaceae bacterium]
MLLTFEGRDYDLHPGESVLDGMSRHGVRLPSACRAGICRACLIRAVHGNPGEDAGRGLKPTWLAAGYFLACLARPASDLAVTLAGPEVSTPARVTGIRRLSPDVIGVTLRPERPVDFLPGQHLPLTVPDGLTRVYSSASLPAEVGRAGLDLHIRTYPGGAMSGWLGRAGPGAAVTIGAPGGECCYLPGDRSAPLLLVGTGTGIAPLMAIARAALADDHTGPIALVHGAADPDRRYAGTRLPDRIRRAARARNVRVWGGPAGDGRPGGGRPGRGRMAGMPGAVTWQTCVRSRGEDIVDAATRALAALTDRPGTARAYLCGGAGSVIRSRRALFLAGLSLSDIYADLFTPAAGPARG